MPTHYERVPTDSSGIDEESEYSLNNASLRPAPASTRCLVPALLCIIAAQALALILFAVHWPNVGAYSPASILYSPALDAIEDQVVVYPLGFAPDLSEFQIPSSPELDAKWENLYSFGVSRIPQAQAALIPNTTSRIPGDPDGYYIIGLDVFHELHCLRSKSSQALDPAYYPGWDIHNPANADNATVHVSHCVDWIRQSIMCHGDTSVLVWQWSEENKVTAPKATIPHVCRNFDTLKQWGKEHRLLGKFNNSIHMDGNACDQDPFGNSIHHDALERMSTSAPLGSGMDAEAYTAQLSSYVLVASAAVLLWDLLNNLDEEYTIIFKRQWTVSFIAYVGARLASLVYVLGFAIYVVFPIGACAKTMHALNAFYPIAASSTAMLFYFRLRAVCGACPITYVFLFLWLCVTGTSVTVPFGADGGRIGETAFCTALRVSPYIGIFTALQTVHDTGVFLAISIQLLRDGPVRHTVREKIRAMTWSGGSRLHAFSRALFQDGQKYYLVSVLINILSLVVLNLPVHPVYRGILGPVSITLTSIMACRVYRHARLHRWSEPELITLPVIITAPNVPANVNLAHSRPGDTAAPAVEEKDEAFSIRTTENL
ncbi:hypothetical protein MKEN_01455900 [Mycena kentingensis (nom. inval.)]|nr:hypothetical protein MKEN_01455900 [Mycena kentingensis (nom. inval.)]